MKFFFLSLFFICSALAKDNCIKMVQVIETKTTFSANVLFPKITNKENLKSIYISCEMYEKTKVGDELVLPEDIKKFNEERIGGIIPQGSMERIKYKLLRK